MEKWWQQGEHHNKYLITQYNYMKNMQLVKVGNGAAGTINKYNNFPVPETESDL